MSGLVQAGTLTLTDFYEIERPHASPVLDAFLDNLYEDLEAAVEHTPGGWLRKKVDHDRWRRRFEYHRLELDGLLLDYLASGGSPAKAITVRAAIEPLLLDDVADTTYISREVATALNLP
jgi:hypothetical protein